MIGVTDGDNSHDGTTLAEQFSHDALGASPTLASAPWPQRILGGLVATVLFAIMALTFVNVFLRYWFNAPITGSEEIVSFGMAILIFSALPLVTSRERHISVGLLQGRLPPRAAWFQHLLVLLVSIAALGIMAWQIEAYAASLASDRTTTQVLGWPLAPLSYFMSTLSGVAVLAVAWSLWRHLRAARAAFSGATA